MSISSNLKEFCNNIKIDNFNEMETSFKEITKKLNNHYYNLHKDDKSNSYIVGSVGRNTAIKNTSDLDIIFNLPKSTYKKFDSYDSNGQSQLLQEVKKVLKNRYPKTDISGDGQVVVIEFSKYTVELVPAFLQNDNKFKYPDTHDGGSWKYTDPLSEQDECDNCNNESNNKYYDFCHIIRAWKNELGFSFSGLLIDTLVYNHFKKQDYYSEEEDYFKIFKELLCYLKNCDEEQSFWYAVGSNQKVYNNDCKFVKKAKESYDKITSSENDEEELNSVLKELLGSNYNKNKCEKVSNYSIYTFDNTEEFIYNKFPIDIKYNLILDCNVSQNGFRDNLLSHILKNNQYLKINKKLEFFIVSTDCPKPYEIYWKVRNVGPNAEKRNCIRGKILKSNNNFIKERTDFNGSHYVECYLIKNEVCVAKAHIDVPIYNF